MPAESLIVLKFGGSVLVSPGRLRLAVHEIYRWRRDGYRVVAVVSALAGKTDELIRICQSCSPDASPNAVAAALALGESESAALLGVQLDRVGLPHRVLTPAAASLVAGGESLDAHPVQINRSILDEALNDEGVVVFPGFVAVDTLGRHVTLGRGGSDLTALFIAEQLGADTCRLIKDVDGLYTSDPACSETTPSRYTRCSYNDALNTDGSIIQHKATRFAQKRGIEFEVGRLGGTMPTRVGANPSVTDDLRDLPKRLRIAIAGTGTVGGGLLELLEQLPEYFEVSAVCCRSNQMQSKLAQSGYRVESDLLSLPKSADVVIELIGGVTDSFTLVQEALRAGCHVVTANKALLAESGELLYELASTLDIELLGSASVGGGLPVLEQLAPGNVRSIRGVLNGTGNFILERVRLGDTFDEALAQSQQIGLAEADPSRDLDGTDSLDKLRVLAQTAGCSVDVAGAVKQSLTRETAIPPSKNGSRLRHIATLSEAGLSVEVNAVSQDDPFYDLPGEMNAVEIEYLDGTHKRIRGKGAGRWPTAESVIADLLHLSRVESSRRVATHV